MWNKKRALLLCFLIVSSYLIVSPATLNAGSGQDAILVSGPNSPIRMKVQNAKPLLHVEQMAHEFGWQAKIVTPGKLLALCRDGREEVCVPIRLDDVETVDGQEGLFVEATRLARAMGLEVRVDDYQVSLIPSTASGRAVTDVPAYHAPWREGRGFQVGQTLPDIPLFDMQGQEVRFSAFLGKQYILYCWASW